MCIFKVNICILCFESQPGNCTPANCMCITWETWSSLIGYHVHSHLKKNSLFKIKTEANEVTSVKNSQCSKSIKIFIFHCEMLILTDITRFWSEIMRSLPHYTYPTAGILGKSYGTLLLLIYFSYLTPVNIIRMRYE